jgi:hypothetical protein
VIFADKASKREFISMIPVDPDEDIFTSSQSASMMVFLKLEKL